jgi:tetratricopeptide (TPR) repeat protein
MLTSSSKEQLFRRVNHLRQSNFLVSAEALISLYVSALSRESPENEIVKLEALELQGDILYDQRAYKRALWIYRAAGKLTYAKGRGQHAVTSSKGCNIGYKMAMCHVAMKDSPSALRELESIPSKYRDARINMMLGSLYQSLKAKNRAVGAYKSVISQSPFAIEAIDHLISLGVDVNEVTNILDEASYEKSEDRALLQGRRVPGAYICMQYFCDFFLTSMLKNHSHCIPSS